VEVLDVRILDADVEKMLCDSQRLAIGSTISRKQEQLRLGDEKLKEAVNQEIYAAQMATLAKAAELELTSRAVELARTETVVEVDRLEQLSRAGHEAEAFAIRERARLDAEGQQAALRARDLEAQVAAFREQMGALQPELIATLKQLGNSQLAGELSKNLSPLAILGGDSVADVVARLLDRLPLGTGGGRTGGAGDIRGILGLVDDAADEDSTG
jgi:major vault protein